MGGRSAGKTTADPWTYLYLAPSTDIQIAKKTSLVFQTFHDGYVRKMSRSLTSRLAAQAVAKCRAPVTTTSFARSISTTAARWEDQPKKVQPKRSMNATDSLMESLYGAAQTSSNPLGQFNGMDALSKTLNATNSQTSSINTSVLLNPGQATANQPDDAIEPYHFHIYSHKHNTHITCTKPSREPIISMSCGNIGFKKSRRGTFDAAYSLTKYVLERLIHTGWPPKMGRLEVVLRGFGQGRDAAVKVLMSPEGKILRDKIIRVADNTRIKFAGTRAEKRRRL